MADDRVLTRIRIYFCKNDAMRFTGHLDLHKTWERIFRRSGLPLAYSQGFHPQPRLNLACALPLGFTSQAEILDAWLESRIPLNEVQKALTQSAPPGITIDRIDEIDLKMPSLQTQVHASEFVITFLTPVERLDEKIATLLSAPSIPRRWRERSYDLRSLIEDLQLLPETNEGLARMQARLAARDGATGRPEELIDALGLTPLQSRVHRTQLFL